VFGLMGVSEVLGMLIAAASGSTRVKKGYRNGCSRGHCTSVQWRGVQRLALRDGDSSRADIKQEKMG
jgi:hypothetical protein